MDLIVMVDLYFIVKIFFFFNEVLLVSIQNDNWLMVTSTVVEHQSLP